MRQSRLAVHADVQSHAKVPLLTLAGLVHVRIAGLVSVLGRTGRTDDGGVHDGAGIDLDAACLQLLAHSGEQGLAQLVVIEQATEIELGRRIGYRLTSQIDANKAAQAGTVVQSASSQARSVRLNQRWMKRMRSMCSRPMGGWPLPALG